MRPVILEPITTNTGTQPSRSAPKRLRVAVLSRVFSPTGGGAERYSIAMVEQLAQQHEIHVFAQQIDHKWPGVTYHRVSMPLSRPSWVNQLWYATATWWATRRGFDVVHSHENTWHGNVQTVHVLPVKHNLFDGRRGLALALQWLMAFTSPRLLTYLMLERLRFAPRAGRSIVVTSTMLYGVMCRAYPQCKPNLQVITPGVTLPVRPADLAANKARARELLGLPLNARLIAFVANDYWKKGLPTLLEALALLPTDCELAVVGSPAQIVEFRAIANGLGVESRVHFLGAFNDVSPLYEAADCLAHPTTEDTFAMVVLEAMAHGLPVVVSDVRYCGIAGKLTHEVNALILSSPTDVAELSEQLLRCLSVAAAQSPLSDGARELAQRYIWVRLATRQNQIYVDSRS
ncbi:MAG: glycosyltransferase family 4 protein [Rhodoferax sp.]|nr:glycosyltransferase family 4 protein [Rhodoferax sp.]